ncbi:MAG TPA: hypothetical protein VMD02_07140 [Candidatus Omnitrophota bacterium]|nr:hypothetical protein [Candidatus Omnitrophota bacterium]
MEINSQVGAFIARNQGNFALCHHLTYNFSRFALQGDRRIHSIDRSLDFSTDLSRMCDEIRTEYIKGKDPIETYDVLVCKSTKERTRGLIVHSAPVVGTGPERVIDIDPYRFHMMVEPLEKVLDFWRMFSRPFIIPGMVVKFILQGIDSNGPQDPGMGVTIGRH